MIAKTNHNGNGNGKIASTIWVAVISGLSAVALMAGIMAAIVAPVQKSMEEIKRRLDKAEMWQDDYMKGKIPSSAERELGEMKISFKEVETQFSWFKQIADERNSVLLKQVEELKNKK